MPKIAISYDDQVVQRRLAELRERGGDPAPAMREIAGHLLDSVNEAFAREASPAGRAWAPLKPATVRDRRPPALPRRAPSWSGLATSPPASSLTARAGFRAPRVSPFARLWPTRRVALGAPLVTSSGGCTLSSVAR